MKIKLTLIPIVLLMIFSVNLILAEDEVAPFCNQGDAATIEVYDSINTCPGECPVEKTLVRGKIYDPNDMERIQGAQIQLTCYGDNGAVTKNTTSGCGGNYWVFFRDTECNYGDSVEVYVYKDGLSGTGTGVINRTLEKRCLELDVIALNIPLIPEFGIVIGTLTIISALGVFFVVRKK